MSIRKEQLQAGYDACQIVDQEYALKWAERTNEYNHFGVYHLAAQLADLKPGDHQRRIFLFSTVN